MFSLIVAAIAALAVGAFIWSHDADVARKAAEKQRAADEKVYNVCVADRDTAVGENAKMKVGLDLLRGQIEEQNKAVAALDKATLAMQRQRVREATKAQDKIVKLDAEMIDLDLALKQRNADMTCDPRIVAQLKAALAQQRRDHPGSGKILEPIADKPVVIKP